MQGEEEEVGKYFTHTVLEDDSNYYDDSDFLQDTFKPGTKFIRKLIECESDCESECILVDIEKHYDHARDNDIRYYINYTKDGNPRRSKIHFTMHGLAYGSHLFSDGEHSFYIMKYDDSLDQNPTTQSLASAGPVYDEATKTKLNESLIDKWVYMKVHLDLQNDPYWELIGKILSLNFEVTDPATQEYKYKEIDKQGNPIKKKEEYPSKTYNFSMPIYEIVKKKYWGNGYKLIKVVSGGVNTIDLFHVIKIISKPDGVRDFEFINKRNNGASITGPPYSVSTIEWKRQLTKFKIFDSKKEMNRFVSNFNSEKGGKTKRGRRVSRKKTFKRRSGVHRKRK